MKILLNISTLLLISISGFGQNTVKGSLKQGSVANSVDILYLPNHNSGSEYVNYLSISIAVDTTGTSGVTPSISGTGNFSSLSFSQASPFSYTWGNQRIFSWISLNSSVTSMSWSNNTQFTGATITFNGGTDSLKVKLVDLTNASGGSNGNTNYAYGVNVSPFDLVDYSNIFFAVSGTNGSTTNTFANGDQYAETKLRIHLKDFSGPRAALPQVNLGSVSAQVKLYPNPAKANLNLQLTSNDKKNVMIVVYDLNGKLLESRSASLQVGGNLLTLSTAKLSSGTYLVSIIDAEGNRSQPLKFIK